jgi:hypothetical protein
MNVSEMSDQDKSVMLTELTGWGYAKTTFSLVGEMAGEGYMNLYRPGNMALAWLVLNWAEKTAQDNIEAKFYQLWMAFMPEELFELPPADAQRLWLDKVLALAIEAGLVAPQEQAGKEEG